MARRGGLLGPFALSALLSLSAAQTCQPTFTSSSFAGLPSTSNFVEAFTYAFPNASQRSLILNTVAGVTLLIPNDDAFSNFVSTVVPNAFTVGQMEILDGFIGVNALRNIMAQLVRTHVIPSGPMNVSAISRATGGIPSASSVSIFGLPFSPPPPAEAGSDPCGGATVVLVAAATTFAVQLSSQLAASAAAAATADAACGPAAASQLVGIAGNVTTAKLAVAGMTAAFARSSQSGAPLPTPCTVAAASAIAAAGNQLVTAAASLRAALTTIGNLMVGGRSGMYMTATPAGALPTYADTLMPATSAVGKVQASCISAYTAATAASAALSSAATAATNAIGRSSSQGGPAATISTSLGDFAHIVVSDLGVAGCPRLRVQMIDAVLMPMSRDDFDVVISTPLYSPPPPKPGRPPPMRLIRSPPPPPVLPPPAEASGALQQRQGVALIAATLACAAAVAAAL